ncbi:MAG: helix-turn-helix transcriptional regulator [Bacteroidales bacterium]|nr:helix-turn-helix transcriptional regulator [Bacteroidales bacterium]
MNKRLQQFLNAENITQSQFADSIGVAKASVSHILAGRNKPGFDFIESMARVFPRLNLEWLISGRGRMYKDLSDAFPVQNSPLEEVEAPIPEVTEQDSPRITKVVIFFDNGTFKEFE